LSSIFDTKIIAGTKRPSSYAFSVYSLVETTHGTNEIIYPALCCV